jgi:5-methyltetrahydropteroyltriglutamate--homocysteine methyltransferase
MSTAKHLPVDQLAISPQCGFSSDIELVQLPKDVRWRKFESLHCRAGLKN